MEVVERGGGSPGQLEVTAYRHPLLPRRLLLPLSLRGASLLLPRQLRHTLRRRVILLGVRGGEGGQDLLGALGHVLGAQHAISQLR